ncbi:MAG: hypothetical protein Fur005_09520 [Roseiflexaceae bacterium]
MRRELPRLEGDHLIDGLADLRIPVNSAQWYAWLNQNVSFTYIDAHGHITIRKEQGKKNAGWYWKAYRRIDGRLSSSYLGKSSDLSLDRIQRGIDRLGLDAQTVLLEQTAKA